MSTGSMASPGLAPGVIFVRHDDIGRLLDLDRGRFFGLNPSATDLLVSFLEGGVPHTIERLKSRYAVTEDEARRDAEAMLDALRRRDLMAKPALRPGRFAWLKQLTSFRLIRGRGLGTLRIRWLLARAWLDLRLGRWSRVLAKWRGERNPTSAGDIEQLDGVIRDIAASAVLLPIACKERALVTWFLCRSELGRGAELVVGVQHYPFAAHTWVELDGRILTDDAEHVSLFEPVVRYT